jgi:hypothetical protein
MNKNSLFERVKFLYGDNININYHTITPTYKNNVEYLPSINKVNKAVTKAVGIKGNINYMEPYHFSCYLDKIYSQDDYTGTKYNCIFVVSGALGMLYTPENFKIMDKLLIKEGIPAVIGTLFYKGLPEYQITDFYGKFKFMTPVEEHTINSITSDDFWFNKKVAKETIKNYTKILLDYKYFEFMNMLFYRYPLEKKSLKTKKNKKSIKKRQSNKSI